MVKNKMGFGILESIQKNKLHIYQGKPVQVNYAGTGYAGVVKEVNPSQNFVCLQPHSVMNPQGNKLEKVDKPMTVPFEGLVISSIKQDNLDNFIKYWNKEKQEERIAKGESPIILPSSPRFRI